MIEVTPNWWQRLWPRGARMGSPRQAASPRVERWVIVDVESSGLDARRDRLLAIAAIAVHLRPERGRPALVMADSFERVLRQPDDPTAGVDKGNILIHGIGVGAQRAGVDPRQALEEWAAYVGDSPLLAYHSDFDRTMIERASRAHLGQARAHAWLDLEPLAAVVHQEPQRRPLDHWLNRYGIECLIRHQAAADTLATAQLLLRLWPQLPPQVRAGGFAAMLDHANAAHFIAGRH